MATKKSLFDDDPAYKRQDEEASKVEIQQKAQTFVGFKILDSCQNCKYREADYCTLLRDSYAGPVFGIATLGKCKHYKKDSSK